MADSLKYHYDYIIVGNGLAGFQLALGMANEDFFKNKSIALIDKSNKDFNDKTWCFWEKDIGKWDSIVTKQWNRNRFISPTIDLSSSIAPYSYKMIKSIDFYQFAKEIISKHQHFKFVSDTILNSEELADKVKVEGKNNTYSCEYLFDSRIPLEFEHDTKSIKIQQHFRGSFIQLATDSFNSDEFIMMDFSFRHKETTSFIYVLPISSREALIEYTFFTEELEKPKIYENVIKLYIEEKLNTTDYQIIETEQGIIPMTDFNFFKYNTDRITKIGTAGGWVKGSTGYSFKHTEKKVGKIIQNIKGSKRPSASLQNQKHRFYDSIFLTVLKDHNEEGMAIFEKFYTKNHPKDYLEFLDESSDILQEIKIMQSLFSKEFINGFFKYLFNKD